jgi:hypothetical protein
MHFKPLPVLERRQEGLPHSTPLIITNQCPGELWPAIGTQHGVGPSTQGFHLAAGETRELTVSDDWQGRVWGRANCSFNDQGTGPSSGGVGRACGSCDCNGRLDCLVGGDNPCTLAEFTLNAGDRQTYYDISLVDGYNLPMAIVVEPHGDSSLEDIPPNLTNPSCVGTIHLLAPQDFNPYPTPETEFLGTNSTYKLPLDVKVDDEQVNTWCPWDLMTNQPKAPEDGHYNYPDGSVERPAFSPCLSACAKYNKPEDCCQGEYNSPSTCPVGEYSKAIKAVCPDGYSYGIHPPFAASGVHPLTSAAFDDQTSTFIIPSGAGFVIIFCPGGRSTNILTAEAAVVSEESHGEVSYGGGGNGNNSDNKATRDCNNYPVVSQIEGFSVLDMKNRGIHLVDWTAERRKEHGRKKRSSSTAAASPGEVGALTWYLMCGGLLMTAGVFIML